MDRESGEQKDKEVKLVHEVKMGDYSRDEARHTVTLRKEAGDGRASVTTSEERVLLAV